MQNQFFTLPKGRRGEGKTALFIFTAVKPQKMVAVRGSKVAVVYGDGSRQGP